MDRQRDHIIRSCLIDLHIAKREEAGELQNRISSICHKQIIPRLSGLCDELSQSNGYIMLDRMEIDVGVIKEHDLEEQLTNLLLKQFKEKVNELISTGSFKAVAKPSSLTVESAEEGIPGRTLTDLLIHFFRYGFIPWWCPHTEKDIRGWIAKLFQEDARIFVTAVEQELQSPAVRFRLISYFNDKNFKSFFEASRMTDLFLFYESFKKLFTSGLYAVPADWVKVRKTFFNTLLAGIYSRGSLPFSETGILNDQKRRAVAGTVHQLVTDYSIPEDFFDELVKRSEPGSTLFPENNMNYIYSSPGMDREAGNATRIKSKEEEEGPEEKTGMEAEPVVVESKSEIPGDIIDRYLKDSFIEIGNAGLVILWPYLSTLFDHLGYLKERIFPDEQARQRAVHLLHYISTGKEDGEEHEWVLNKLLCGLSPAEFVPAGIKLTGSEKDESEAMIRSVINNWKVLKNTSSEGFRNAFIMRKGIINPDPYGWILKVERRGYDILLDKIPWTVSVVKLSWNEYIIYVQW